MRKFHRIMAVICFLGILCTGCTSEIDKVTQNLQEKGYVKAMSDKNRTEIFNANFLKQTEHTNPISGEIFCADPTAVEYNGRLYVFGTNDHQQFDAVGKDGKNTYEKIQSFVIFSTEDMVNWTYHGTIDVKTVAPWIISSWAPSIVSRVEDDGLTHFYLYFSNNGCGVGVITATDPLGPWSDPLGSPLVYTGMDGIGDCPNPFDPGACIDENGVGWLTFGGGTAKNGSSFMPGVTRIVQLGDDMLSFASGFSEIKAPYFFEASELNYINGTYVYTYNNNWESRIEWGITNADRPGKCSMSYMTTKTPLDTESWVYRKDYLCNPGEAGFDFSNNHSHLHKFKDSYYLFYHTLSKQKSMSIEGGFRSLCVSEVFVNEEKLEINKTKPSEAGVIQIQNVIAAAQNQGESFFAAVGIGFEINADGHTTSVKSMEEGAVLCVKGVEFEKDTSHVFSAMVKGRGRVEVRLDDPQSESIAAISFEQDSYHGVYDASVKKTDGVHDVYLVFSDADLYLDYWQFH